MSHDSQHPADELALDPFIDAALRETERAASRPPPAFAAVLARAHSLAPDDVPPPAAAPLLTALPSGHVREDMSSETSAHAADLAPFLTAARSLADADVAERVRRPAPPLPRPRTRAVPLALAAALLLAIAGIGAFRGLAVPGLDALVGAQADATVEDRAREHRPAPRAPEPVPQDVPITPSAPAPVPQDIPVTPTAPAPVPQDIPAAPTRAPAPSLPAKTGPKAHVPEDTHPARPAGDPIAAELARLDDEAEALLLAGAHDEADARYQQMIQIGGRRTAVEHAYADRWLLARRAGDDTRQLTLLRAYLLKFPRGRFADEATAGLCRLADADTRPDCWRDYTDRFPRGAYRREADEAIAP